MSMTKAPSPAMTGKEGNGRDFRSILRVHIVPLTGGRGLSV